MILIDITVNLANENCNNLFLCTRNSFNDVSYHNDIPDEYCCYQESFSSKKCFRKTVLMDGYLCSLFHYVITTSSSYRTCFSRNIVRKCTRDSTRAPSHCFVKLFVNLVYPKRDVLDYKGNEMFEILCLERRELDIAMAWLSTLGGAFSALGDSIEKCAAMAGKISVRQLEIAMRLGDPFLVARCKLYMALSLLQRHKFRTAKHIVLKQYAIATSGPIKDNKLKSMCQGIWAKMKYDKMKYKEKNKRELTVG